MTKKKEKAIRKIIEQSKKYLRYLLESILNRMNTHEYKKLEELGIKVLNVIEAFPERIKNNPDGYYGFSNYQRIDKMSISFFFSTREYKLDISIKTNEATGYIKVKIPPSGAEHTNCDYKYWIELKDINIRIDKTGSLIIDSSMGEKTTIIDELQTQDFLMLLPLY